MQAHGVAHDGWVDGPVGPRQAPVYGAGQLEGAMHSGADAPSALVWQIRTCTDLHDLTELLAAARSRGDGTLPAEAAAWALHKAALLGTDPYSGALDLVSQASDVAPQLCGDVADAIQRGDVLQFAAADAALAGLSVLHDGPAGLDEDAAWPLIDLSDQRSAVRPCF